MGVLVAERLVAERLGVLAVERLEELAPLAEEWAAALAGERAAAPPIAEQTTQAQTAGRSPA